MPAVKTPENRVNRGEVSRSEAFDIAREVVEERRHAASAKREQAEQLWTIPKSLVIICGHEGSGKTYVTKTLEEMIPITCIDKDDISDIFTQSRNDDVHARTRDLAYNVMYDVADQQLKEGRSVILDAPFDADDFFPNEAWVKRMREIAERNNSKLKVVWCYADPETKLRRVKARASTREATRTDTEIRKLASKANIPNIPFDHIHLDTGTDGVIDADALATLLEVQEG